MRPAPARHGPGSAHRGGTSRRGHRHSLWRRRPDSAAVPRRTNRPRPHGCCRLQPAAAQAMPVPAGA
ncbi:hypothetical protein G6F62_015974 [Rhizopus arrhizus]|nr:hypothetical protein G6F62_015974 [Rhizopus arrhizus]